MVSCSIINLAGVIFVYGLVCWAQAEVFTAISDCEPLLDTHRHVIDNLDGYIQKEEKRLLALKKQLNTYKTEHEKAMEDVPNYLGNPINAFTLIKRLTKDIDEINRKIKSDNLLNVTSDHENVMFPTREDLVGAAHALTRLQATYKLEVNELAEGLLNGVPYSSSMSADDCFELGRALFNDRFHKNSIAWMMEALRKYQEDENDVYSFTLIDVMDYVSWSYYVLGDLENALVWIRKLIALDQNHSRARANELLFEESLAEKKAQNAPLEIKDDPILTSGYDKEKYEALCRGDYETSPKLTKKLHCFYLTENHPFLRLAPIKAEKKFADPDVYVFYDVITDEEIAHVKSLAQPRFRRAVVYDPLTGGTVPAHYRVSKTAWLTDEESPIIARISRRTADFTGLNVTTAEDLQVANYGIGGHYEPHFDFSLKGSRDKDESRFEGNRIATVLFYISEVAEGGATVFTHLGLTVFPIKNAALFWLNLHPSGEGDISTKHAACPVLRGSKWVSNKWFHEGGQQLNKKVQCTPKYQPEEWLRPVPKPILKPRRNRDLNSKKN